MRNALLLAIGAATLVVGSSQAAFLVNRNGVTWDATYEGDVAALTASTPAWSTFDVANSNGASSDGNTRTHITGNEAGANSYEFTGASWTGAGPTRTAEIRVRVPRDGQYQAADGQGSFIIGTPDALDFRFYFDGIAFNFGGVGLSTVVSMDTSDFHVYRVTYDPAATPQANLYIDGSPTPAFSTSSEWFTGFDKLVYGDISTGGEAGKMEVDYISWTAGVHAPPVPEPASLTALALGAFILSRKSR